MDKIKWLINTVAGVAGVFASKWLGGPDKMLIALLAAMALDYVTGILVAGVFHASPKTAGGGLESRAGLKGIIRKVGMLALVMVATQADVLMGTELARDFTVMFLCANEALSVIENAGLMGVPVPQFLTRSFEILRDKAEGTSHE